MMSSSPVCIECPYDICGQLQRWHNRRPAAPCKTAKVLLLLLLLLLLHGMQL
jgi:hypothetical protein